MLPAPTVQKFEFQFDKFSGFSYIEGYPEAIHPKRSLMKKREAYRWASNQVRAQVKRHTDVVATLANTMAILKQRFPNFFWVGVYFLRGDQLILGPFQGPPACMKLNLENGVCAHAVRNQLSVTVANVHEFPGHVACDSRSNSEIVVPLFDRADRLMAVLDVDSETLDDFDEIDQTGLENIAQLLTPIWQDNPIA